MFIFFLFELFVASLFTILAEFWIYHKVIYKVLGIILSLIVCGFVGYLFYAIGLQAIKLSFLLYPIPSILLLILLIVLNVFIFKKFLKRIKKKKTTKTQRKDLVR